MLLISGTASQMRLASATLPVTMNSLYLSVTPLWSALMLSSMDLTTSFTPWGFARRSVVILRLFVVASSSATRMQSAPMDLVHENAT